MMAKALCDERDIGYCDNKENDRLLSYASVKKLLINPPHLPAVIGNKLRAYI